MEGSLEILMEENCCNFIEKSRQANILHPIIAYFLSHSKKNTSSRHPDRREEWMDESGKRQKKQRRVGES